MNKFFRATPCGLPALLLLLTAAFAALILVAALELSGAQVSKEDAAKKDLIRVATYNVRGPSDRSPNSTRMTPSGF